MLIKESPSISIRCKITTLLKKNSTTLNKPTAITKIMANLYSKSRKSYKFTNFVYTLVLSINKLIYTHVPVHIMYILSLLLYRCYGFTVSNKLLNNK